MHIKVLSAILVLLSAQLPWASSNNVDCENANDLPQWERLLSGENLIRVLDLEGTIEELRQEGQYEEGIARAESVLAIRLRLQGAEHWQTMEAERCLQYLRYAGSLSPELQAKLASADLIELNRIAWLDGRIEAERTALEIRRQILGDDHYLTLHSWGDLGNTLWVSGMFSEAEDVLWEVKLKYERLGLNNCFDAVWLRSRIATLLKDQGRLSEAERYAREGVEGMRRLWGDDHWETHYMRAYLGIVLMDQGRLDEAEPLILAEVEVFRQQLGDYAFFTHFAIFDLADLYYSQGRYTEAESILRDGLQVYRTVRGDKEYYTYYYYYYIARTIEAQGRFREAESFYRKALGGMIEKAGEWNQKTQKARSGLAQVLTHLGRYSDADSMLNLALEGYKQMGMQNSQAALVTLNRLGGLREMENSCAEAEMLYQTALERATTVYGKDHQIVVRNLNSLAFLKAIKGDLTTAEKLWIDAADRFEVVRLRTSYAGLRRIDYAVEQSPLGPLAACLAQNGESLDAWKYYEANLARGLFDVISTLKFRPLTQEEQSREIELTARLLRTEEQIGTSIDANALVENHKIVRDLRLTQQKLRADLAAFEAAISDKYGVSSGRSFELSRIQKRLPDNAAIIGWVDVEHPLRRSSFSEHWSCVIRSEGNPIWIELSGTGDDSAWTDADRDLISVLKDALTHQSDYDEDIDLPFLCQKLHAQRIKPIVPYISDVTQLTVLPAGQMAGIPVELLTDNYTISYVPSATMYAWLKETAAEREEKRGNNWPKLLAIGDPIFKNPTRSDSMFAVIPDYGMLLLQVFEGGNAYHAGIRMGDVLLSYGNDWIVDSETLDAAKSRGELLAESDERVSIPVQVWRDGMKLDFAVSPGMLDVIPCRLPASEAISALRRLDGAVLKTKRQSFPALPGSRLEVETIANLFNSGGIATAPTILLGSDASESQLASLAAADILREYNAIHIATHALMDDRVAMRSALIMSHEEPQSETEDLLRSRAVRDGKLTAEQIVRTWRLNADLVTLSGCETALGKQAGGEGYLGFSQALFIAGARSLVLSLWKVEDTPTMLLMRRFYENLLGKFETPRHLNGDIFQPGAPLSKAEALHEAKIWLRDLTWDELLELENPEGEKLYRGSTAEPVVISSDTDDHPFEHPHYWAAFILMGDPG